MRTNNYLYLSLLPLILLMNFQSFGQKIGSKHKKLRPAVVKNKIKKETRCSEFNHKNDEIFADEEAAFYASLRYIIVYNDVFDELTEPERRMQIIMKTEQFNEDSLKCVFKLINKMFPSPQSQTIEVHTNLDTIETPEERNLLRDSADSRFSKIFLNYKRAFYIRYDDGQEMFTYTTQLTPTYKEKKVFIDN